MKDGGLARRQPSICFVVHSAYSEIAGGLRGHVGGAERQATLICRGLAARGYRVALLTWDEGQPNDITIDGVRVIKMCRREAGIPGLRFFHPRWSSLNGGLRKADADVYFQTCAEYVTGQVALWCQSHSRRFVFSVVSDPDCDMRLPHLRTYRERILYRYGLRRADLVIVQTQIQQLMLWEGFGVRSRPMPALSPDPRGGEDGPPRPHHNGRCRVLWLGRIAPVKRLELLLEVAAALPEVTFDVAGPSDADPGYLSQVLSRSRALPNVTLHGRVGRDRLPELFERATFLCCTSLYEGFPSVFLEAWSYGLPVISTFDPDGLIAKRRLGVVAGDVLGLARALRTLHESRELWLQISSNAREYYLRNHTLEAVIPMFDQLFVDLVRNRHPRSPGEGESV